MNAPQRGKLKQRRLSNIVASNKNQQRYDTNREPSQLDMKDNTAILVTSDSQSQNMDALDAMDTRQRIQKMATTKIS